MDDLDIEGISKLKPADRQVIKDKAIETLNEIRKVIPSDQGPREPQSPDPQGGEHRLTWDNLGHLQPPLHSTAIRRSTPTVTPRRQFMNEREINRTSRNADEGNNFELSDEDINGDRRSQAVYSRPYDNTWVIQDTTRLAHDGDFSSDATPPGWGGRERSPAGGRADLTLPSRGENQPLAREANAVNWAVEAQKERQRIREEDQREFEKLQRRAELLERERMLQRELDAIRSDNDHPANPSTKQTDRPSTKRTDWTTNLYARQQDGGGGHPTGGGPSGSRHSTGGGPSGSGHSTGGGTSGRGHPQWRRIFRRRIFRRRIIWGRTARERTTLGRTLWRGTLRRRPTVGRWATTSTPTAWGWASTSTPTTWGWTSTPHLMGVDPRRRADRHRRLHQTIKEV